MILIQTLRILYPSIQPWSEVLRNPYECLQDEEDVRDEPENRVRRFEMCPIVGEFVVFNHDEACDAGEESDVVESGVDVGSLFLLFGGVGWLED